MNRIVIVLVLGVVICGVVLWFVAFRDEGLPKVDLDKAQAEIKKYDQAKTDLAGYVTLVSKALEEHPDLFSAFPRAKKWPEQCRDDLAVLNEGDPTRATLEKVIQENRSKDRGRLDELRLNLSRARDEVVARAGGIANVVQRALRFAENMKESVAALKADHEHVKGVDVAGLQARATQATKDWPGKRSDLEQRIGSITDAQKRALDQWKPVAAIADAGAVRTITKADAGRLAQAAQTIHDARQWVDRGAGELPGLIEQLYWSRDRILVDMDIREAKEVTFHLKIKIIRTRAVPKGQQVQKETTEQWEQVSKSEYERRKNQLGMAIEQKPAGRYDHEATRVAQPPGYRYIASPSVRRNHYGYWGYGHGYRYWHWYPRYHYMHSMYWGSRYGAITPRDYSGFRSANQSGRSYLGRGRGGRAAFGSAGTATKSKYSGSKYVRTGGLRQTRYVKSGGSYRGSKYARSSYRSSSRSGSRFGGGK